MRLSSGGTTANISTKLSSRKEKGKRLERLIAQRINDVLGGYGVTAKRMIMSGAIAGWKGDVFVDGLPVSIEAKNQEKINIWECWDQAESQAGLGKMAVLVFSRNFNKDPLTVIRFEDLLTLFELAIQAGWVSHIRKGRRTIL